MIAGIKCGLLVCCWGGKIPTYMYFALNMCLETWKNSHALHKLSNNHTVWNNRTGKKDS